MFLQGIDARPLTDENIFEWMAKIQGLKNTVWEGTCISLSVIMRQICY